MKIIYTKINEKYYIQDMITNAIVVANNLHDLNHEGFVCDSYQNNSLGIYVMITNQCNFSCKYCFEKDNNKTYINFDFEKFIHFLKNSDLNKYNKLEITFTGGEPSLEEENILTIIDKINSSFNIETEYEIITNGFKRLNNIKAFKFIQVSIDGNREKHNLSRNLKKEIDSYDVILSNIKYYLSENVCVKVRINIVDNDVESYKQLIDDFDNFFHIEIMKKKLIMYFDFLDIDKKSKYYINDEMRYIVLKEIYIYLLNKNIFNEIDYRNGMLCMAKNYNSMTVDLDGCIYKCYSLVGKKQFSIYNINDNTVEDIKPIVEKCSNYNCLVYEKCYGGCPFENYLLNGELDLICKKDFIYKMNVLIFMLNLCKYKIIKLDEILEEKYHVEYKEI